MLKQMKEDEKQGSSQHPLRLAGMHSIYSGIEGKLLYRWQRIRQMTLKPIAAALNWIGITPDMLSLASVALGIGFLVGARTNLALALILLAISVLLDGLDGVLARYTRNVSARGSFTDMFCDQLVTACTVGGLVWANIVMGVLGVLFVYIYTALVTFLMLHEVLAVSSSWLIRPSRILLYAFLVIYYFTGRNWLNDLLIAYLGATPLLLLSFTRLRRAL
jgi:phosphatidylglycerophosphate synthase